jgi:hypothetical protein
MAATDTPAATSDLVSPGAGTDAERRAAQRLASQLERPGRSIRVEPFWCRPNWALAHAWHAALALLGSLVAISSPRVGLILLLIALLSTLADYLTGISLGRRLTPEHASQNVVATPEEPGPRVRVLIVAAYDSPRAGLGNRAPVSRAAAALRRAAGPLASGWLGLLELTIVWEIVVAALRLGGAHGTGIGALQLPPTVVLVLATALALELAGARWRGPERSSVTTAIALTRALDAAPPANLTVELVLAGAGGIGLRRHLRAHRRELRGARALVIGVRSQRDAPNRSTHWWTSDGELIPLRYTNTLRNQCARLATPEHPATPTSSRGNAPTVQALLTRFPAIAIGAADPDQTLVFGLLLIDAIDALVAQPGGATPA